MKRYEKALIVGGSRGAGKELALLLSGQGTDTTVVARGEDCLAKLKSEAPLITTLAMDATSEGVADKLVKEIDPDLLILTVGYEPKMIPFHEQSWDEFSGAWNTDTKIAHAFSSAALTQPMKKGGVVVSFSSGAGLSGSRLSGGYAGAKRMQHFLTDYAQKESELLDLGLTFYSIIPKQLIQGTVLGLAAAEAYSAAVGKPVAQFLNQWDEPLTANKIANHVASLLRHTEPTENKAYVITGTGMAAT
ncbi:NAD(P)-dependent dehydrogenase (short-subunit alcohol dehydrogenase family) [Labrenzia sp. EL_159]|nr:NAD(P)-dependent dehydrogenase (short-subunit alcohol dehydrogenase family) [Labrenzia sp. EL_162]MBG6197450.1 NAD(P)-dependent dehydrogenase (short-subunit alcohol dehydrogenase family) [Labrenzia sp. EL_159]